MDIKKNRFAKARIIGARALQIAQGSPIFVKIKSKDPIEAAKIEFKKGKIPITAKE